MLVMKNLYSLTNLHIRTALLSGLFLLLISNVSLAQQPILAAYPDTTIAVGKGITIKPALQPIHSSRAVAFASIGFKGLLSVNPITGVLSISNTEVSGTYRITVKAFNSTGTLFDTATFTLTVENPLCSNGMLRLKGITNVGSYPRGMSVGDINGDKKMDLLIANSTQGKVTSLLGDGFGGFTISDTISVSRGVKLIVMGDFNGNGNIDFACISSKNQNHKVSIRLGDGKGGFNNSQSFSVGPIPSSIVKWDYNNDGIEDLAVGSSSGYVYIFKGTYNGKFIPAGTINVGTYLNAVTIGDFNNDGKQDVAVCNYIYNVVRVFLGNGLGSFIASSSTVVGDHPKALAIADFNKDGVQDIAVANYHSSSISILIGIGAGKFNLLNNYPSTSYPSELQVSDFNGDGNPDLIIAGSNAQIVLGNGLGSFSKPGNLPDGGSAYNLVIGDFNTDGKMDAVTANVLAGNITGYLGGGVSDLNVYGNQQLIRDGEVITSTYNGTSFGCTGSHAVTKYFYIKNNSPADLLLTKKAITISGSDSSLFSVGDTSLPIVLSPMETDSFSVTFFAPTSWKLKKAIVHIAYNDCGAMDYHFAIDALPATIPDATLHVNGALSFCAGDSVQLSVTNASFRNYQWIKGNDSITGATLSSFVAKETGVYKVIVSNSSTGCNTISKEGIVSVFKIPEVWPVTGIKSFCKGITSNLGNAKPGGRWSSSDTNIAPVNNFGTVFGKMPGSTVITYTITGDGNCSNNSKANITIKPLPYIGPIQGSGTVCQGNNIQLTNITLGGTWISTNNNIAIINSTGLLTGISPGMDTIIYKINIGCTNSVTKAIKVLDPCLMHPSIDKKLSDKNSQETAAFSVVIFPNPSSAAFNLNVKLKQQKKVKIQVFNINGSLVFETIVNSNQQLHFGNQWPAGMYIVELSNAENRVRHKLIKQ